VTLIHRDHFKAVAKALDKEKRVVEDDFNDLSGMFPKLEGGKSVSGDYIGNFPKADPNCAGCGQPLRMEDAWMSDGCPCNTPLGVNNTNETRWRLLMQLQQNASYAGEELRKILEDTKTQFFVGSATRVRIDNALDAWSKRAAQSS
jgi:hypothetical protein